MTKEGKMAYQDGQPEGVTMMRNTTQFVVGSLRINDFVFDGQSLGERTMSLREANLAPNEPVNNRWWMSPAEADADFYESAKTLLNTLSAEDVISIKVFRGQFISVVVKTRSGHGLNAVPSYGTYAYRPLPMQLPKQFYSPKYNVKNIQPDLRSTIHWEPNLITGKNGNASLSFYAADQPGTYTVVVEGTDMQGHFGVTTGKISVAQNTAGVK